MRPSLHYRFYPVLIGTWLGPLSSPGVETTCVSYSGATLGIYNCNQLHNGSFAYTYINIYTDVQSRNLNMYVYRYVCVYKHVCWYVPNVNEDVTHSENETADNFGMLQPRIMSRSIMSQDIRCSPKLGKS